MRKVITLFVLLLNCCYSMGMWQEDPVRRHSDSLLRQIRQTSDPGRQFKLYLDLSLYWSDLDTAKAFSFLADARRAAGAGLDDLQQGLLHQFKANIIFAHDIELAKAAYMEAERYLSRLGTKEAYLYRSKLWNNYGILFQIDDQEDKYMNILITKAIPYARAAGDSLAVGNGALNIGLLMSNSKDYANADAYYNEAMRIFQNIKGTEEQRLTVYVLAARAAMNDKKFQPARSYLDSAGPVFARIPHSLYAPHYFRSEGTYYRHVKQKEKSLEMFQRALHHAKQLKDEHILRDIHFEQYATYRDFGDHQLAKQSLRTANTYSAWAGIQDRMLHIREMGKTEYQLGNYKAAYEELEAYLLANDTLQDRATSLKVRDLEKKYQTVEKEKEILELESINHQQQLTMDRTRLWLILVIAGLIIAVLATVFGWKLAQSNKRALLQREQLHTQELQALRQAEQLKQYRAVIQVQEEERNRIARDLHDGLGGLLAGVKLRLSTITGKTWATQADMITGIQSVLKELDHSSNELRRIARNMMPEALLYVGLQPALEDLCNYLDSKVTAVKFQGLDMREQYPQAMLVGIYRIVQELLNNAIRHAEASQVIVQCSDDGLCFYLTVEDNGKGFNAQHPPASGLGLRSVENRVTLLNGKMEIDAHAGRGTTINIEIPLEHEAS